MTVELYCSVAGGAIIGAMLLTLCTFPMLGILQQGGYSEKALLKWYYRKTCLLQKRMSLLTLSLVLLVTLFNLCFSFGGTTVANLVSLVPFAGMCVLFICSEKKGLKVPLYKTGRIVRICVLLFLSLAIAFFGAGVGLSFAAIAINHSVAFLFRYVPLTLFQLFVPLFLSLASVLDKAYEVPHNRAFVKKAQTALQNSKCIKVGITGSFGKTSVKNFAKTILEQKYKVLATPASYNTPIGIAKTVAGGLDCDVFLAEMGARKVGDIQELCEIVRPEYGIITGVCAQHIQTFQSVDNIRKEKGVLAQYAKTTVLGASASEIPAENALKEGEYVKIENLHLSEKGTKFTLEIEGESAEIETALLGRHFAEDIALAAALCKTLGMSMPEIAAGISCIRPVPHRLEKIQADNATILDDSYNCNSEGAKNAVETLKLFGGKKYVVTPGIVELGELEERENNKLGALLIGLDSIILVGETLVLAVRNGYLAAGGDEQKLRIVPGLQAAQDILAKELGTGDCVLFLNDLPDIYQK